MTWEDYPYVAKRQNSCLVHGNDTTSFVVAYQLNPDELSIIDWLVNYGPVNIGINVPPDMKPYAGGIYRPSDYDCQFKASNGKSRPYHTCIEVDNPPHCKNGKKVLKSMILSTPNRSSAPLLESWPRHCLVKI